MNSDMDVLGTQALAWITGYGLQVIGGVVILIVGWLAAGVVARATERALAKTDKVEKTLRQFLRSVAYYLVIAVTIVAVLANFGVQTASLITVLGAAGLAIGLALQGTLSNIAAGVMLLLFRPFKVDDYVEVAGHAGSVRGITLFVTELATPDNVQIVVPNAQVWGAAVKNYSHHATRRLDLFVGIAYEADVDKALALVSGVIDADERTFADPAPMVVVGDLGESSVDLIVRTWCKAGDYWPLKFDLTKRIKERLEQEGISIPYPQRTVHLVGAISTPLADA